jgi:hypothetical protein
LSGLRSAAREAVARGLASSLETGPLDDAAVIVGGLLDPELEEDVPDMCRARPAAAASFSSLTPGH